MALVALVYLPWCDFATFWIGLLTTSAIHETIWFVRQFVFSGAIFLAVSPAFGEIDDYTHLSGIFIKTNSILRTESEKQNDRAVTAPF